MRLCRPIRSCRALGGALLLIAVTSGGATAQTRLGTFAAGTLPPATGGGNPALDPGVLLGQVFRTPTTPGALTALTYWFWTIPGLYDGGGAGRLAIYAFDGAAFAGAPVYDAALAIPTNPVALELTAVSWAPNVTLAPGALYVALLSGANPLAATAVLNETTDSPDNSTGGIAMTCDATTRACASSGDISGVRAVHTFEATFQTAAVPEPGSLVLLAAGAAMMAGVHLRRRGRYRIAGVPE